MSDLVSQSACKMAEMIRLRHISSRELMTAHLNQIQNINPRLNAAIAVMADQALAAATAADHRLASNEPCGPLHGVPFSVKDSIDVAGLRTTAGTVGRRNAEPAAQNATLVERLAAAGAIPTAKTNLPDLLFSFETDNLIFGRTNNPYDVTRTPGGSSGGEASLIAACGSPLGLGSDCLGSVRLPAAFCGIASIKPTSGRLPRTGHVPPAGGWFESLWQIGPMARRVEDVELAMRLLAREDDADFTSPPMPLLEPGEAKKLRIAFFTDNGTSPATAPVKNAIEECAKLLHAEPAIPPGVSQAFDLEMAILGADGGQGIDDYLKQIGSTQTHPLLENFLSYMRPHRTDAAGFAKIWAQWDQYRAEMRNFFHRYDAVLCPVYPAPAFKHGGSLIAENFRGFSYTMAWSVAGYPAATVRCASENGLPINVQIVTRPWQDLLALRLCHTIEDQFGGWQKP